MADRVETIGIYSAYGFAKEAGYTGTKAEFEQGLKNSAEYADNAASSANAATNAKNAAVTAKTDAQAAQSAAETAQGLAEDAQAAAEEAKNDAEAAAASLDASTIARIDGFYENMGVGTADQLMASQKAHNSDPYIFRTSGGTSDIGNREELEIVGGSVVWNQLVQNGNFTDGRESWTNSIATIDIDENNIANITTTSGTGGIMQAFSPVQGHVVFVNAIIKNTNGTVASVRLNDVDKYVDVSKTDWQSVANIIKYNTVSNNNVYIRAQGANASLSIKSVNLFDLTAMFGSEIADHIYELEQAEAGAGVAWFRKYFPNDYYDYNPGELMHVSDLQSHDTVGFNLWDEILEFGNIDNDTGRPTSVSTYSRSANFIPVIPNTTYSVTRPNSTFKVFYYDSSKNYLEYVTISSNNNTFTTPEDTAYIKFAIGGSTTPYTEYNNDICINLSWSGTRDGEYEAYVKHSYPLDPSLTLRGIPKLTADGDLTYDGDIYKSDGTVERRYGIVDLGTLEWHYQSATLTPRFTLDIPDCKEATGPGAWNAVNAILSTFKYTKGINVGQQSDAYGFWGIYNGFIYITDSDYTDIASFKTAMSGVYLVYELAEPTTEEAEPYTSPQIVDDWGTEEFVTTSLVPVGHNTSYPANLRDKLQHLPDLPDDDGYYMTQVDGTQMSLIRFRIPQAPAEDGEYILKATVSNGTPIYTWEAVVEAEGGEG